MGVADLLEIRQLDDYNPDDLAALDTIEYESAQKSDGVTFIQLFHPPRHQRFGSSLVLLAYHPDNGKLVGSVGASIRQVLFPTSQGKYQTVALIFSLRVSQFYQRQGIGRKIMQELETRLLKLGVDFCYTGVALNNLPSKTMFMKGFQYKPMYTDKYRAINVQHMYKVIGKPLEGFAYGKMVGKESETWVNNRFGDSFFFPSSKYPVGATVYSASQNDKSLHLLITDLPEKWVFGCDILWMRIKVAIRTFIAWLFPRWFEAPIPFGTPMMVHMAYPFSVTKDVTDQQFEKLQNALWSHVVTDMVDRANVIMFYADPVVSGLSQSQSSIISNSRFVSPTLFNNLSLLMIGKSLKESNGTDDLAEFAKNQQFWFIDGKDGQ